MRMCATAVASGLLLSLSGARAQTAILAGRVTSDSVGGPIIAGAEVAIPALKKTTRANFGGDYRFPGLSAGAYLVRVRFVGFAPVEDSVLVVAGQETIHDFVLSRRITTLPAVEATAKTPQYLSPAMRIFEERRKRGFGHFLTAEDLRNLDRSSFRLSSILSAIPGTTLISYKSHSYLAATRGQALASARASSDRDAPRGCWVAVYFDGLRISYLGDEHAPDMNAFEGREFEAIEYYAGPSHTPVELNMTGNVCVVLVLWSREK